MTIVHVSINSNDADVRHWWSVANYPEDGQIDGKSQNSSERHQCLAQSSHFIYHYTLELTSDQQQHFAISDKN